MKVLVPPGKFERIKRSKTYTDFVHTEKNVKAASPPPPEKLQVVKKPEEDKERNWHIDKDKQLLKIQVQSGHKIFGEASSMLMMADTVKAEVKKAEAGEALVDLLFEPYVTYFTGEGEVGFAGSVPGELVGINLEPGDSMYAQRTTFIAGIGDIDISIHHQQLSIGSFLGGQSLLLEKFTNIGTEIGTIFFNACGDAELIEISEGYTMVSEMGSVVAWEDSVSHDVKKSTIKSGYLGGEGMFMIHLSGSGTVIVQTTNLDKMKYVIGQSICLAPPPIMAMELALKEAKKGYRRFFIGG
jgi:uncharacterized protein (AIM24 family)